MTIVNGHSHPDGPNLPPFPIDMIEAIGEVHAGVTVAYAARQHHLRPAALTKALADPAAKYVAARSEWDLDELLDTEFRDTPDIAAGLVPVGVSLITAAPKVGKTRLLAQLSDAATRGSEFLGVDVTRTPVLSLALEDGARRIRSNYRSLTIGRGRDGAERLTIRTTSLRLDAGGLDDIETHLDRYPLCRLVIIDVLERVRPNDRRGARAYTLDYEALAPLQRVANLRQVAVLVVHHSNQRSDVVDVFEKVSGTAGLIGVVDALLFLQRRRGDNVGTLSVAGREVEDQTLALSFENGWWGQMQAGIPTELLAESSEVRTLWLWLADHDGASTDELAVQYGRTKDTTLKLLRRLEQTQLVDSTGRPTTGKPVCWQAVRASP